MPIYIVPPRSISGSADGTSVVTSLNGLRGNLTLSAGTGIQTSVAGNAIIIGVTPNLYILKDGDSVTGNLVLSPSAGRYGIRLANFTASALTSLTGSEGGLVWDTTNSVLKLWSSGSWLTVAQTGALTLAQADINYWRRDGTNTPSADMSMSTFKLRLANLPTQVSAGTVGQTYYNTDTNTLGVYTPSGWIDLASGSATGTVTSITAGAGLTGGTITVSGTIAVDLAASFAWTGAHTFGDNISFSLSGSEYGLRLGNVALASLPTAAGGNVGGLVWDTTNSVMRVSNGSSWLQVATVGGGSVLTGSGTINAIPKWDSSTSLNDSIMVQSGSDIVISGGLRAESKSFDIPHPTKPNKRLVYGSLEGPEHAVYHRGSASGCKSVRVNLPDYWHALVGCEYSIYLTSFGNYGIYVDSQDEHGFIVRRCGNIFTRNKPMRFTYQIIGPRTDLSLEVEQEASCIGELNG